VTRQELASLDPALRPDPAPAHERSYYLDWIRTDLAPWKAAGGITKVRVASGFRIRFTLGNLTLNGYAFVNIHCWDRVHALGSGSAHALYRACKLVALKPKVFVDCSLSRHTCRRLHIEEERLSAFLDTP